MADGPLEAMSDHDDGEGKKIIVAFAIGQLPARIFFYDCRFR